MQSAKKTFRHEYKQEDILEDKRNTVKYKAFQASIGAKNMSPDLRAAFFISASLMLGRLRGWLLLSKFNSCISPCSQVFIHY